MTQAMNTLSIALSTASDPDDVGASSGLPTSIVSEIKNIGINASAINDMPQGWRKYGNLLHGMVSGKAINELLKDRRSLSTKLTVSKASAVFAAARQRTLLRNLPEGINGIIQIGADYPIGNGIPMITMQDSTVRQAIESYAWAHLRDFSDSEIGDLVERQRDVYRASTACCAATHWAADSIVHDYGIPRDRVHVVGVGSNFRVSDGKEIERDWESPHFLFVGKDWARKNGPAVLRAFEKCLGRFPKATLDIVGNHPSVSLRGVTGHGLLRISDPLEKQRLIDLFKSATAFVMPSSHEPAGSVYVEAASAGIASIGTQNGGAATIIGEAGILVNPDSAEELYNAMSMLCDPRTAKDLGDKALIRSTLFTWRKVTERLIRAFSFPDIDSSMLADFV